MSEPAKPGRWLARLTLPALSGALTWTSFAPAAIGPLAFVSLVPLVLYAWLEPKGWRAFLGAWLVAGAFSSASLVWLRHVWMLAPPGVGLYVGLYSGLLVMLLRWGRRWPPAAWLPVCVVAVDWLRSWFLGGFPFYLIGYTQHSIRPFIQVADLGGVWLVSALVAAVNGVVAHAFRLPPEARAWRDRGYRASAVSVGMLVALAFVYGIVRLATLEVEPGPRIAIVQPNVPQDIREIAKGRDPQTERDIIDRHLALTRRAASSDPRPDLIVWPESAIPVHPLYDPLRGTWITSTISVYTGIARETGVSLLAGALVYEYVVRDGNYVGRCRQCELEQPMREDVSDCERCGGPLGTRVVPTNSAVLFSPTGEIAGRYDKVRLVAFSERMPLPLVDRIVASQLNLKRVYEFRPGAEFRPLEAVGTRLGVQVCYEAVYPDISRKLAGNGAPILVNISNEGWFRDGAELDLMLAMGVFRAVESRAHFVRATNTGISAMIEPTGRIQAVLEADGKRKEVEGILAGRPLVTGAGSLYRGIGDAFAWLCVVGAVAGLAAGRFVDSVKRRT